MCRSDTEHVGGSAPRRCSQVLLECVAYAMLDKVTEKNRCDLHGLGNNEEDGGKGEDIQSSVKPKSYTIDQQ